MIDPQEAPTALMHPAAAAVFEKVRDGSGIDFLARCGDVLRPADFHSAKDGVADRSWHKTGRAFDYDQTSTALVIVPEPKGGKQYFRTYLYCKKQDGSLGAKERSATTAAARRAGTSSTSPPRPNPTASTASPPGPVGKNTTTAANSGTTSSTRG